MRRHLLAGLSALLTLFAFDCGAQPGLQPPNNQVTLDASASVEVPVDTLTATLYTEEQGPDPSQLATKVNARLDEALAKAKTHPTVQARSGNYQTSPIYDRSNQISGWRIRAEVNLESRDFKEIGALAGQLQPTLKLGTMSFSLSRSAREAAEAKLTTEALARFQEKARAVAKALGFPGYTIGQIAVRSEGNVRPPIAYRAVAMQAQAVADAGPVPVEGGTNAVTVVVSGSVVLGAGK